MEGRRLPQTNGWRLLQEVDKDKEVAFPLWPPEGMYPADSLTVAHQTCFGLLNSRAVINLYNFQVTEFVVICYSSRRKLTHQPRQMYTREVSSRVVQDGPLLCIRAVSMVWLAFSLQILDKNTLHPTVLPPSLSLKAQSKLSLKMGT